MFFSRDQINSIIVIKRMDALVKFDTIAVAPIDATGSVRFATVMSVDLVGDDVEVDAVSDDFSTVSFSSSKGNAIPVVTSVGRT